MVEGNGLENRHARKGIVGSNPTLSAKINRSGPHGPGLFICPQEPARYDNMKI